MLSLTIIVGSIIWYYKKRATTDYELEIKQLRQMYYSGKLDKNSFLRVKNRMSVETSSSEQGEILEKMLKDKKLDPITYTRMKKALKISLDQKLKKLNNFA